MLSRLLKKNKDPGPVFEKKRFFGNDERAFYTRLRRALPTCHIFPDIELSALLAPASADPKQKLAEINLLIGRKVSYAVLDAKFSLLFVIELTSNKGGDKAESNKQYLKAAGIKCFCWCEPSTEDILRALGPYCELPPPKPEQAAVMSAEDAQSVRAAPQPAAALAHVACLNAAAIELLTPKAQIKTGYPHVWERICLFCTDPQGLAKYLASLALQDRGGNRAGFPPGVLMEITEIQNANERFMPSTHSAMIWGSGFVHR